MHEQVAESAITRKIRRGDTETIEALRLHLRKFHGVRDVETKQQAIQAAARRALALTSGGDPSHDN